MLKMKCEAYCDEPLLHLEGHKFARRLIKNKAQSVQDLLQKNVKSKDILSTLKK